MEEALDDSSTRARWSISDWVLVVVAAAMWLDRFGLIYVTRGLALDMSWTVALSQFHLRGLRAGVDWFFTYGPLGFCETGNYEPTQFWPRMIGWKLVFEGVGVAVLVGAARRMPQLWQAALFLGSWFLLLPRSDAHWPLVATALAALALASRGFSWPVFVGACAVESVLALVKFAWTPIALFALGCCVFARSRGERRSAGIAAAIACAVFAATWMLAGQSLTDLPAYFASSLAVASGYAEAMTGSYAWGFSRYAAAIFALSCAVTAACALARPRSVERVLLGLLVLGGMLVAYKASIVRHGPRGPLLVFAPLALCLLARVGERRSLLVARLVCIALAVSVGIWFQGGWSARVQSAVRDRGRNWTASVQRLRRLGDNARLFRGQFEEEQRRFALPRTRAVVGDETIDFLGDLPAALLRQPFNYHPRPAFQSYVAFSPRLVATNERFYSGPDAPAFVLQSLPDVDGQLSSGLDNGALAIVLARYEPLLVESSFTLWKRLDDWTPPALTASTSMLRHGRIGEWIDVADAESACRWMRLDLRWTLLGKLARDFGHPPLPRLRMRTTEGEVVRRFVPSLAREGLMIDPVLRHQWDLMRWVAREPTPRLLALRVTLEPGDGRVFEPEFDLELTPRPELVPRSPPCARERFLYSMFATAPASATLPATARERLIYDSPVLFVSAPSVLRFAVGPGEHTIRGSFGVESPRPQPPPDPVRFEALAGDTALLWSRTLDAARVAEDRGAQPFELTFSVDEPSELWLRTEAARSGDVRVDYAYWGEISVDGNARAHGGGAPPLQHDH